MKKEILYIPLCVLLIVAVVIVYRNFNQQKELQKPDIFLKADNTSSVVELSDSLSNEFDFIFSTAGGKMFIMVDGNSGQEMNNMLIQEKHFSLYDLGAGNAFFIRTEQGPFLCTATHCAKGLEEYSAQVGADITFIDYNLLPNKLTASNFKIDSSVGYPKNLDFNDYDSLIVKGYLPGRDGHIRSAIVRGTAVKVYRKDFPEESEQYHSVGKDYLQNVILTMRMEKPFDLGGLSGSPAFNSKGEVVGIFSGRNMVVSNNDTVYYIRVSMLKKE